MKKDDLGRDINGCYRDIGLIFAKQYGTKMEVVKFCPKE